MDISSKLLDRASKELQSMVDAVRDDAPAWEEVLTAMFGSPAPTLGAVRRTLQGNAALASFLRRPTESVTGTRLQDPSNLAEAVAEIAGAAASGDHKALRRAQSLVSTLVVRAMA